jgi:tRNA nucleotidyltransferase (CCA-adding enzyme)
VKFREFFSPFQQEVITQISSIAPHQLYAVGGIVRDFLLGKNRYPIDLDLVIEGDGISVAQALHRLYPETKLQTYPKFLTAELLFPDFTLDIATARQEVYPQGGANPIVTPCSLELDLERRDFTVNALALAIQPGFYVEDRAIIDRFNGIQHLNNKTIRSIRPDKFMEDPRRIFRAVRFAIKLDFTIDTDTLTEIKNTIDSGVYRNFGGSRFRSELLYIFHPDFFPDRSVQILQALEELDALSCIHTNLQLYPDLGRLLRRLKHWHSYFLPDYNLQELALELIASNLSLDEAIQVELIRGEGIKHLSKLPKLLAVLPSLHNPSPSIVFDLCQGYELPTLLLAGVLSPHRRIIWHYLTRWRQFTPLITGDDLKAWGCPKGKTIGLFLKQLRSLQLDGKLHSYDDAHTLVKTWLQESA